MAQPRLKPERLKKIPELVTVYKSQTVSKAGSGPSSKDVGTILS